MWRNHFSQLLFLDGFNNLGQREKRTAVQIMSEPSASEMKIY